MNMLARLIKGSAEIFPRINNYGVRVKAAEKRAALKEQSSEIISNAKEMLSHCMKDEVQAGLAPEGRKIIAEDAERLRSALQRYEERDNELKQATGQVPSIGHASRSTREVQKLGSNLSASYTYIQTATGWLTEHLKDYTYDGEGATYPAGRRQPRVYDPRRDV